MQFLEGVELKEFVSDKPHLQLLETDTGIYVVRFPRNMGEQHAVATNGVLEREEWIMRVLDEHQRLREHGVFVPVTRAQSAKTKFYFDKTPQLIDGGVVMVSEYISGVPLLEMDSKSLSPELKHRLWQVGTRTIRGLCSYASQTVDEGGDFLHDIFPPKQFMFGHTIRADIGQKPNLYMIDTEGMLTNPDLNILEGTAHLISETLETLERLAGKPMPAAKFAIQTFQYGDFSNS